MAPELQIDANEAALCRLRVMAKPRMPGKMSKKAPEIHSGKKEGETGEKVKCAAPKNRKTVESSVCPASEFQGLMGWKASRNRKPAGGSTEPQEYS
jgi:hypothetical protein